MKTLYEKSMFLLYALLAFFVPIIITPFTQESFEFPKMFFIYITGTIIITLYFINSLLFSKFTLFKKLKRISFTFPFLIVYIISTIFSSDIYTSLWGYYSRFNGGFISILFFIFLAYIAGVSFKKYDFINLFILSLFALNIVSLFGIFQYYNIFDLGNATRVYSTFGQPNWLAQYLIMLLPIVIYLYGNKSARLSISYQIILLVTFVSAFWCLWLTFSLSGFFGFITSLLFLPKGSIKKYIFMFLIAVSIMLSNFSFFSNRVHDVYIDVRSFISTNFVAYAEDEYLVSDPGFIRREIWIGSLSLFSSSPKNVLLGIGPQTFPYEFQSFRAPILNYSSEWSYVINRPHNYYIEILVELGIFGLLFYSYLISQVFNKSPDYIKPSLIGFYITNIFGWPVVATSFIFWMTVSYIILNNFSKDS